MKKEKLYFVFYEHENKLSLSTTPMAGKMCDVSHRSTVLVQCCFDLQLNKVQNKMLVYKAPDYSFFPDMNTSVLYNAPDDSCFIYMTGHDENGNHEVKLSE